MNIKQVANISIIRFCGACASIVNVAINGKRYTDFPLYNDDCVCLSNSEMSALLDAIMTDTVMNGYNVSMYFDNGNSNYYIYTI